MRVLVTGGAGFLGSHLVEELVAAAHEVTVLDDLSTGDLGNLEAVAGRIEFESGCVTDGPRVAELARGRDLVVHLASTVGVDRVASDPTRTREVIEAGTDHVLAAARRRGTRVVTISSSEVYGFAPPCPVREDELPFAIEGRAPRLAYARAKLAADRAALECAARGENVLVVRPFNLIGPRQDVDGGAVLPRFVRAALAGDDLVVHGDGAQRRSLLDVRDAAEMLSRVIARGEVRGALNLGGTLECSMLDLARGSRS
jgi:UDP-glucose 4-epimerase